MNTGYFRSSNLEQVSGTYFLVIKVRTIHALKLEASGGVEKEEGLIAI